MVVKFFYMCDQQNTFFLLSLLFLGSLSSDLEAAEFYNIKNKKF